MDFFISKLEKVFMEWQFGEPLAKSLSFFIVEIIFLSVILLTGLTIITYIRKRFLKDDFAEKLKGKRIILVYLGMALLGIVSPFCSCSTIPIFLSFATLGIPSGPLFTFLIVSPLVQDASMIMIASEFGGTVLALYITFGVVVGTLAGFMISKFTKDEKLFQPNVLAARMKTVAIETKNAVDEVVSGVEIVVDGTDILQVKTKLIPMTQVIWFNNIVIKFNEKWSWFKTTHLSSAMEEAWTTYKGMFTYIIIGLLIGSMIHGMVPYELIKKVAGTQIWYAPIVATLVGIPIYADDVMMVPIAKTLVDGGAGLGTSISFLMSSSVVSIPSFIMISKILKKATIIKFVVFLIVMIIGIGFLYNLLQPYITY